MWNKRSEEDSRNRAAAAPAAPEHRPTAAPAPVRAMEPEAPRSSAVLGKSVVVKGDIYSKEDLTIDGEVEGTVTLEGHRLTVGPNGKVQAESVKAREVVVHGSVRGSVEATEKVYIKKDAQLVGDVQTAGIIIEDGAYFKGGIDIRKNP
jgi:cytoskeletal protein CcmA (bactofilin family)